MVYPITCIFWKCLPFFKRFPMEPSQMCLCNERWCLTKQHPCHGALLRFPPSHCFIQSLNNLNFDLVYCWPFKAHQRDTSCMWHSQRRPGSDTYKAEEGEKDGRKIRSSLTKVNSPFWQWHNSVSCTQTFCSFFRRCMFRLQVQETSFETNLKKFRIFAH